ncbi:MAG: TolC family protein [Bacteroidota bacterium]|nr:TolC family protein [Bacteroidota bacterium]
MFRIFFVINFLIIGIITNSLAQNILTLEEAIRIGLENNYSIKIAQKDLQIIENDVTIGNAGFLPLIQAQATRTFTIEDSDLLFLDGRVQDVQNAQANLLNGNVILEWTIFNGLGMFIALERLNEFKRAGQVNARIIVENTMAGIINTYYLIVLEKERLRVLDNSVQISNVRLNIAKDLYEVGRTSKSEYLAARVDLNADKSAYIQQQEIYNNAKIDLNLLLGRDLQVDYSVLDEITVDENLDIETLLNNLVLSNANLQFAKRNMNIADLQMREIRAQRMPQLRLVGGYRFNRSVAEAGFVLQNQSSGFNYGLVASFNIFNGFNQTREIQNARISLETTELQLRDLELQLNSEIRKVYQSYTNNINLLELENANLALARENAAIALDRFKLGRSTPLELREAQRNEVDAESRTINASYSIKIAEIELLRLSGNLLK